MSRHTSLLTELHAHVAQSASGPSHDSLPSLCLKLASADIPVLHPSFTQLSTHGHLSERPALTPVLKQHPASFSRPWALLTFLQSANHPLKQNKSISASVSASICPSASIAVSISVFLLFLYLCLYAYLSGTLAIWINSLGGLKSCVRFCDLVSHCSTLFHSGRSVNRVTVFALKCQQCDKDWGGNVGNFPKPCVEEAFVT